MFDARIRNRRDSQQWNVPVRSTDTALFRNDATLFSTASNRAAASLQIAIDCNESDTLIPAILSGWLFIRLDPPWAGPISRRISCRNETASLSWNQFLFFLFPLLFLSFSKLLRVRDLITVLDTFTSCTRSVVRLQYSHF